MSSPISLRSRKRKERQADIEQNPERDGAPPTPEAVKRDPYVNDQPIKTRGWTAANKQRPAQQSDSKQTREPKPSFTMTEEEKAAKELRARAESEDRVRKELLELDAPQEDQRPVPWKEQEDTSDRGILWPFKGTRQELQLLSWPSRTEFPPDYAADLVKARPAWYDTTSHRHEVPSQMMRLFPGLKYRPTYRQGQLFGEPVPIVLANLANLEGKITLHSWLADEDIFAGLQVVLQDFQQLVWLSLLHGWSQGVDSAFFKRADKDVERLKKARFHVWPVHLGQNHWALAIYDQKAHKVWWMDSLCDNATIAKREARRFAAGYGKFLAFYGAAPDTNKQPEVVACKAPQQSDGWSCGLHVLENARMFFRETSTAQGGYYKPWTDSLKMVSDQESDPAAFDEANLNRHLLVSWISFCRMELGHQGGTALRLPQRPSARWEDRRGVWDVPNAVAGEHGDKSKGVQEEEAAVGAWGSNLRLEEDPDEQPGPEPVPEAPDQKWQAVKRVPANARASAPANSKKTAAEKPSRPAQTRTVPDQKNTGATDTSTEARSPVGKSKAKGMPPPPPKQRAPRTYAHTRSPDRYIEPSHKVGWMGWISWESLQLREARRAADEEREEKDKERRLRRLRRHRRSG